MASHWSRTRTILHELRHHAPFTLMGAVLGIAFMLVFRGLPLKVSHGLFMVFHPGHVLLSAMVTAALFRHYRPDAGVWVVLIIGYVGSVGVATVSDSVIPYLGERLFGLSIPTHASLHSHQDHEKPAETCEAESSSHSGHGWLEHLHLGFIEEWYLVNPAAILGVIIAFYVMKTELPHAFHVLISTWASSAHILMNSGDGLTIWVLAGLVPVLFLAVWLPCCLSDIVFPSMFFKVDLAQSAARHHHSHG